MSNFEMFVYLPAMILHTHTYTADMELFKYYK